MNLLGLGSLRMFQMSSVFFVNIVGWSLGLNDLGTLVASIAILASAYLLIVLGFVRLHNNSERRKLLRFFLIIYPVAFIFAGGLYVVATTYSAHFITMAILKIVITWLSLGLTAYRNKIRLMIQRARTPT